MYHYEGDNKNIFSVFEFGYLKDDTLLKKCIINKTNYISFATESGLKLGMAFKDVVRLKGKSYTLEKEIVGKILKYTINDAGASILKQYEMSSYFMELYFRDDIVYKVKFGFEYP
uniref:Uncharacterized protein n=1 Tax=Prevotella sp. GTC17253 TaxID=3236793 RepID=A0AB33J1K9_9BACT